MTQHREDSSDEEFALKETVDYNDDVRPAHLAMYHKRCKRKFRNGVFAIKVGSTGKLLKRTVFVGLKPEFFEVTSKKFFDEGFHLSEVIHVRLGTVSDAFDEYARSMPPGAPLPKDNKSCVVFARDTSVSLVFEFEDDRRDFLFVMHMEMHAVKAKYADVMEKVEGAERV